MTFRCMATVLSGVITLACSRERAETGATVLPTRTPASAPIAAEALDRLDTRAPVPLLPMMAHHQKQNMRDHLLVVQEVVAAIGKGDYAAIEQSAKRIGYSEQMGQMCTHMGAEAPGFTDRALAFHRTADGIAEAARRRDMTAVLSALNETLAACTSCHSAFKQQVVAALPSAR